MDKLQKKIETSQKIMKALKISDIRYHMANTNLGPIDLQVRFGEDTCQFLLDSTVLDKEVNDKLFKLFELK